MGGRAWQVRLSNHPGAMLKRRGLGRRPKTGDVPAEFTEDLLEPPRPKSGSYQ